MEARGHSFREISDLHRRAAIALSVEREWAYVLVRSDFGRRKSGETRPLSSGTKSGWVPNARRKRSGPIA